MFRVIGIINVLVAVFRLIIQEQPHGVAGLIIELPVAYRPDKGSKKDHCDAKAGNDEDDDYTHFLNCGSKIERAPDACADGSQIEN